MTLCLCKRKIWRSYWDSTQQEKCPSLNVSGSRTTLINMLSMGALGGGERRPMANTGCDIIFRNATSEAEQEVESKKRGLVISVRKVFYARTHVAEACGQVAQDTVSPVQDLGSTRLTYRRLKSWLPAKDLMNASDPRMAPSGRPSPSKYGYRLGEISPIRMTNMFRAFDGGVSRNIRCPM